MALGIRFFYSKIQVLNLFLELPSVELRFLKLLVVGISFFEFPLAHGRVHLCVNVSVYEILMYMRIRTCMYGQICVCPEKFAFCDFSPVHACVHVYIGI